MPQSPFELQPLVAAPEPATDAVRVDWDTQTLFAGPDVPTKPVAHGPQVLGVVAHGIRLNFEQP